MELFRPSLCHAPSVLGPGVLVYLLELFSLNPLNARRETERSTPGYALLAIAEMSTLSGNKASGTTHFPQGPSTCSVQGSAERRAALRRSTSDL